MLKRTRNNDQPEAMFNSRPRLNHLKTFPIEGNQTFFQVWVGIIPDESRPSSHIPESTSEDSSQPEGAPTGQRRTI